MILTHNNGRGDVLSSRRKFEVGVGPISCSDVHSTRWSPRLLHFDKLELAQHVILCDSVRSGPRARLPPIRARDQNRVLPPRTSLGYGTSHSSKKSKGRSNQGTAVSKVCSGQRLCWHRAERDKFCRIEHRLSLSSRPSELSTSARHRQRAQVEQWPSGRGMPCKKSLVASPRIPVRLVMPVIV